MVTDTVILPYRACGFVTSTKGIIYSGVYEYTSMSKWLSVVCNFMSIFYEKMKTSAVSTTDGWLKPNLASCVILCTSDTLMWRHFYIFSNIFTLPLADAHPLLYCTQITTNTFHIYFVYMCVNGWNSLTTFCFCCWSLMCWEIAKSRYTYVWCFSHL